MSIPIYDGEVILTHGRASPFSWLFILSSLLVAFTSLTCAQPVRIGAELLLRDRMELLSGKRVGIICNHTSVLPNGTHLVDTLRARGISVTALFGPEHGIRGIESAGVSVEDSIDMKTGIPVFSLYGAVRKPEPEMLRNVDVLVFDIQDVGARFYTYVATMAYAMEAAAENGKQFVVLDRPNPINGVDVEGPILDMTLRSMVGMYPVPIRHGLTAGELARMILGEGWINDTRLDLVVIPMEGWRRSMWYDETGLPWIPPSPNMLTLATATVYPGTCLFEATNLSEGRGTSRPFEYIGGPGVDADSAALMLNAQQLEGVRFSPVHFTPKSDSTHRVNIKHHDKLCGGVFVQVTDRQVYKPVRTALTMIRFFGSRYRGKFDIRPGLMEHLLGDTATRQRLESGSPADQILGLGKEMSAHYLEIRQTYLLYR